jgi:hypothetical protein
VQQLPTVANGGSRARAAGHLQHLHGAHGGALGSPPRQPRVRARLLPRVPDGPRPRQGRVHRRRAVPRRVLRRRAGPGALPCGAPRRRVRAVVRRALRGHVPRRAAHVLPVSGLLRADGGGRVRRRGERYAVRVPGVQAPLLRAVRRGAVALGLDLRRVREARGGRQGSGGHDAAPDGRRDAVAAVPQLPVHRGEN